MRIVNYFEYEHKQNILVQLENAQNLWRAIPFLIQLLKEQNFHTTLGNGALFLLLDEEKTGSDNLPTLAAFVTLCDKDEVDSPVLKPWIGFVFTFPAYRGKRLAGKLIEHCIAQAAILYPASEHVFVSTDEDGLYEKYGFSYLLKANTIHGDETKIFARKITGQPTPVLDSL